MDLFIQPEDLGLQAPHLKKSTAYTHYTWKHQFLVFQSRIIGGVLKINFNKVNKINIKIKCVFRHITPVSSNYKKHIISSFHKLLSWKQFFPPLSTCFRTICLWDADHFTDFHTWFIYSQCLQVIPGTTLTPILHSSFPLLFWLLSL